MLYFGKKFTSTQRGKKLLDVVCDKCETHYRYELVRVGVGIGNAPYFLFQGSAKRRAQRAAEKNIQSRLQTEQEMVPCPKCNWVNEEMVENYRSLKWPKGHTAGLITILTLIGSVTFILIAAAVTTKRTPHMGQIYLALASGAFFLSCLIAILCRYRVRSRINPNLTYPKKPVLLPGTPPALVESGESSEDGSVILDPIPSESQAVGDPQWVMYRPGQITFPPTCCVCLEPAKISYKSPFRLSPNDRDVPVPLCRRCASAMRRRWWLAAVGAVVFISIVAAGISASRPRDQNLHVTIAVLGVMCAMFAIAIIPNKICRPYRIRVVDPTRGIARMFFRNRRFTDLLNEQVRAADGILQEV